MVETHADTRGDKSNDETQITAVRERSVCQHNVVCTTKGSPKQAVESTNVLVRMTIRLSGYRMIVQSDPRFMLIDITVKTR